MVCVLQPVIRLSAGCKKRTCSLQCSKAHKEETGCTGKRAREAFVPLSQYEERHLMSDFRFVEEVAEAKDAAEKRRVLGPRLGALSVHQLPRYLKDLVHAASHDKVQLQLMHPGMTFRPAPCTMLTLFVRVHSI